MARIRELYEMRFSINPIVDLIDKCVGEQWMAIPIFWAGGADDTATIVVDVPKTFFLIVIYGELFGPGLVVSIETGKIPEVANVDMRLEFMKYCIPDDYCWSHQFPRGSRTLKQSIDPRWAVDGAGSYAPGSVTFLAHERDNQEGLRHLLRSKSLDYSSRCGRQGF
ncbi:hypothetical protein DAEQUDRAFT_769122 [Daedalea quercina L-15889]|uniref:Uncharacterized protein n=1 Tax=Daedalea quercina L-15889 TaxID=1314783 RepID=A0A165M063_9APHY|nr:hypothetical protein DAEQUDRAFT_769122 [Daedalea quercina L-15889]